MAERKMMIKLTFRNGKELILYPNDISFHKSSGSQYNRIWFDGLPQVKIFSGIPNVFYEGEYYLYNGAPIKQNLFDYFPDDWDKEDEQFNVIDVIFVNSKGIILPEESDNNDEI
jgi:hypothetical protein